MRIANGLSSYSTSNRIHVSSESYLQNNLLNAKVFRNHPKLPCTRVYLCTHPSVYPKWLLQLHHVLLLNARVSG